MTESAAALERKAALYDRLAAGNPGNEDDFERYEVDFLMKGAPGGGDNSGIGGGGNRIEKRGEIDTVEAAVYTETGALVSEDMAREQERRKWEREAGEAREKESTADERRNMIEELEKQTREARDRATMARQERQSVEARKRERLKAEFLKKKLEAAKKKKG